MGTPANATTAVTPAQLAEAPPNDPMHPAIIERLTKDMEALARNLDAADAWSMASDAQWKAIELLGESLEHLKAEVELHRPHVL